MLGADDISTKLLALSVTGLASGHLTNDLFSLPYLMSLYDRSGLMAADCLAMELHPQEHNQIFEDVCAFSD